MNKEDGTDFRNGLRMTDKSFGRVFVVIELYHHSQGIILDIRVAFDFELCIVDE
jgi:hypothetical protein